MIIDWRKSMNDSFGQVMIDGLSVNVTDVLRNASGKTWRLRMIPGLD